MIKKFASQDKDPNLTFNNQDEYQKIVHIINSLYKIKEINRKIIYSSTELRTLVLNSEIGKKAIADLKELKITRAKLIEHKLNFFNSILGDQFSE